MSEQSKFISADEVSKTKWVASIYLASRAIDSQNLAKQVVKAMARGERHDFENGYSAQTYPNGEVALIDPDCGYGKLFGSYDQFAAYYLAKFW